MGAEALHPSAKAPGPSKAQSASSLGFSWDKFVTLTLSLCSFTSKMGLTIPVPSQHCWKTERKVKRAKLALC